MYKIPDKSLFVHPIDSGSDTETVRRHDLKTAMWHVAMLINTLDVTSSVCECCGRRRYNNWNEFQAFQALSSVMNKLRTSYLDPAIANGNKDDIRFLDEAT